MVRSEFGWSLLNATVLPFTQNVIYQRDQVLITPELLDQFFADVTVLHGPFRGLRFPGHPEFGSSIVPILLGSYESEIVPAVEAICHETYTEIINVGCAEGYYAVGLAMRIPSAKVYAYDIDSYAQRYCRAVANLNGVSDRVIVAGGFTRAMLASFPFSGRGLIFCDCEGCEKVIFDKELLPKLRCCDLLIEVHDNVDIEISAYLADLFAATHTLQTFTMIDNIKKAKTYHIPEVDHLPLETKRQLFAERRGTLMEWFFLRPRADDPS